MNSNIRIIVYALGLFIGTFAKGQRSIDSSITWAIGNISKYHGNVYLDTTYLKADTATLSKQYGEELSKELALIRLYKMRLANFDFKKLTPLFSRVRSLNDFYKEKYQPAPQSSTDSLAIVKSETLSNTATKPISDKKDNDSIYTIESFVMQSSFFQALSDQALKGTPKRMTILSVFESESMYLIIYHFMILYGYPHYYVKSELVLK